MENSSTLSRFSPKPPWLRVGMPTGEKFLFLKDMMRQSSLHTVCEEARCPNVGECWGSGTATFMVLGDVCTRGCRFCAVKSGKSGAAVDPDEPRKVAEAVKAMGLDYVVITSVDRDDLEDQGAAHFARVVRAVKEATGILVEILIPDFRGEMQCLEKVVQAGPDVIAHNLETVKRLTPWVRDRRAEYEKSLFVLGAIKRLEPTLLTKSSLMLGLGETREEIETAFRDLRSRDVDFITLGQYLKPTPKHLEVGRYVEPKEFEELGDLARSYGFRYAASGPLVRSSYRAGEFFVKSLKEKLSAVGAASGTLT